MGKKQLTAVIAAGVAIVVVLAVILVSMLTGGNKSAVEVAQDAQFVTGTTINGQDVSGLTAEQAKEALAQAPNAYTFTLTMGDKVYQATGEELQLTYNEETDLNALLEQQAQDATQLAFTVENLYTSDLTVIKDQVVADYGTTEATTEEESADAEAAEAAQSADGEEAVAPENDPNAAKNAYLQYDEAQQLFVIVPDEPGTNVDTDKVMEQVQEAVVALNTELTLDLTEYVQQAEVTADSESLKQALDDANARLDMKLTYTFTPDGGSTSTVTIDRATLGTFFCASADGQSVDVDEEVLGNYVASLVSKYSIAGKSTPFKTTGGSTININVATAGQSVDSEKLYNDMLDCLKNNVSGTRTAPYTAKTDDSAGYWGGNYVEIDQTSQHLWLYKNGQVIVSCDIVSGNVANNTRTPNGCFTIFAKNTNRYLQGSNTDGSRYKTWVSYFMPFSGGCGIHDATWRSTFGGTEYYYSGSHGCVGVTLSNAKTIYNNVSVGTHVVIYGGISASQLPSTSPTITANATEVTIAVGESLDLGFQTNSDGSKRFVTNGDCISIDGNGVITGVKEGSCHAAMYLGATSSFSEGHLNVLVHVVAKKAASDQSASASIGTNSLTVGGSTSISVSGNQTTATFSSSNSSVASVDSKGNVTAVGAGSATITVTCSGNDSWNAWSKSFDVTVAAKAPEQKSQSISASAPSAMTVGTSASVSVSGAQTAISFKSSDPSVVSVDASGNIAAKGVGTATITVSCASSSEWKEASATCTITVQAQETQSGGGSASNSVSAASVS
jgi:hypothetical protein